MSNKITKRSGDTAFGEGYRVANKPKPKTKTRAKPCERCGKNSTARTSQTVGQRVLRVCGSCSIARDDNEVKIASRCAEAEKRRMEACK